MKEREKEKCKRKSITKKDAPDYQAFALMANDKSFDLITLDVEHAIDLFSQCLQYWCFSHLRPSCALLAVFRLTEQMGQILDT